MKFIKKILIISFIIICSQQTLIADMPHYLDFKFILNQSDAGKKAQNYLKSTLDKGIKDLTDREKKLQGEEKKIIQQKKIISAEEYRKKVTGLRTKVASLQKERNSLLRSVDKQRKQARTELLNNLNPIIKDYMKEKKITMVVDKKGILVADEDLDITKDVISLLNNKLKSIKLN